MKALTILILTSLVFTACNDRKKKKSKVEKPNQEETHKEGQESLEDLRQELQSLRQKNESLSEQLSQSSDNTDTLRDQIKANEELIADLEAKLKDPPATTTTPPATTTTPSTSKKYEVIDLSNVTAQSGASLAGVRIQSGDKCLKIVETDKEKISASDTLWEFGSCDSSNYINFTVTFFDSAYLKISNDHSGRCATRESEIKATNQRESHIEQDKCDDTRHAQKFLLHSIDDAKDTFVLKNHNENQTQEFCLKMGEVNSSNGLASFTLPECSKIAGTATQLSFTREVKQPETAQSTNTGSAGP